MKERGLKQECGDKEQEITRQIDELGMFFDAYLDKLEKKEVYFSVQPAVKNAAQKRRAL